MISPKDIIKIENEKVDIDKLIEEIDESIKSFHGWYIWEFALIEHDLSVEIRNKIAKKYIEAGWNYVYHQTSKENGERPGLSSFMFSTTKIEEEYVKNKVCVQIFHE